MADNVLKNILIYIYTDICFFLFFKFSVLFNAAIDH